MLGPNEKEVSLATLNGGAAIEIFDRELKNVLQDIADMNTKAEDAREVHLIVKIVPDEAREFAKIGIVTKAKLGKRKTVIHTIWLSLDAEGKMIAVEEAKHPSLFEQVPQGAGNKVSQLRKE